MSLVYFSGLIPAMSAQAGAAPGVLEEIAAEEIAAVVVGNTAGKDSVFCFYYPFNSDFLMYDYQGNKAAFEALDVLLRTAGFSGRVISIEIIGSACKTGPADINMKISKKRNRRLASYMRTKYPNLNHVPIRYSIEDSDRLYRLLTKTIGFSRGDISRQMRRAALHFTVKPAGPLPMPAIAPPAQDAEQGFVKFPSVETFIRPSIPAVRQKRDRIPLFAVKTNLLFDLAMTPNIEVEIPLNWRLSVCGEFQHGWWLKKDNTFCWQVETLGLEGRYWLGNRRRRRVLTGWFMGAFAGMGVYDFQLERNRGIQGDFYISAGLSLGYMKQLGNSPWRMEFSAGGGFLTTDYTRYQIYQDKLTRYGPQMRFSGLAPLKAKVSLAYLFQSKKEMKGR
ncbi:MAG: DUF3575 domain-containing protein [Mediterranea sp.]|nr:DUF3575 domain-containing protein [Mediterranea sp.]